MAPGVLSRADRTMLASAIAEDGVQIEPEVPIVAEYGLHGVVGPAGDVTTFALVRQRCDARGAWLATERASLASDDERAIADAVTREAERAGGALARAGYFGPFGVDAFTYRGASGAVAVQPRSEVNARYGMGFAVGVGRADRVAAIAL